MFNSPALSPAVTVRPVTGACHGSCVCAHAGIITAIVAAGAAIRRTAVSSIVCFSLAVGILLILQPLRLRAVERFLFERRPMLFYRSPLQLATGLRAAGILSPARRYFMSQIGDGRTNIKSNSHCQVFSASGLDANSAHWHLAVSMSAAKWATGVLMFSKSVRANWPARMSLHGKCDIDAERATQTKGT